MFVTKENHHGIRCRPRRGTLIGALSWLGLAAWLEAQRLWVNQSRVLTEQLEPASFERLYQQPSRG
jgi:hypothetical protein